MLVYEKTVEGTRHLYGTVENIPSNSDNQLVYQDADGDTVTPSLSYTYLDDGHGGITMVETDGTQTFLGVNIKKTNNELVNIIPGGDYQPADKVLKSIRFKKKPIKLEYDTHEETVDPTGAVIEATWETKEKSIIPNNDGNLVYSFKAELVAGVDNAIVATYSHDSIEKTAECAITVIESPIEDNNGNE